MGSASRPRLPPSCRCSRPLLTPYLPLCPALPLCAAPTSRLLRGESHTPPTPHPLLTTNLHMYSHTDACTCTAHRCTFRRTNVHTHMHAHTSACTYTQTCTHALTHVLMHIRMHAHTHVHMHMHTVSHSQYCSTLTVLFADHLHHQRRRGPLRHHRWLDHRLAGCMHVLTLQVA